MELVALATCLLFSVVLHDEGSSAAGNLPYLGMACGLFARLATIKQPAFTAVTSLLGVAQRVAEKARSLETWVESGLEGQSQSLKKQLGLL